MAISTPLREFRNELRQITPLLARIDWTTEGFTLAKALVCAVFSKAAYMELTPFELSNHDRIKVVPCLDHHRLAALGVKVDLQEELQTAEMGITRVITRPRAVVVVTRTANVIIIAIRGTRISHWRDVRDDLRASKLRVILDGHSIRFHLGFYLAITECLSEIEEAVRTLGGGKLPVYVTGHSLGGAMGAILHAIGGAAFHHRYFYETVGTPTLYSDACIVFGMPRYCDAAGLTHRATPFTVVNQGDPIPRVPPRLMGFVAPNLEYEPPLPTYPGTKRRAAHWLGRIAGALPLTSPPYRAYLEHSIETYLHRIKADCP